MVLAVKGTRKRLTEEEQRRLIDADNYLRSCNYATAAFSVPLDTMYIFINLVFLLLLSRFACTDFCAILKCKRALDIAGQSLLRSTCKGSQVLQTHPRIYQQTARMPSRPKLVLIYRPLRDRRLSWPRHQFTHKSSNRYL